MQLNTPHSATLPGRVIGPSQRPLLNNTHKIRNLYALRGIRTLNPSGRRPFPKENVHIIIIIIIIIIIDVPKRVCFSETGFETNFLANVFF